MQRYSFERLHDLELRCLVPECYTSPQHYADNCGKAEHLEDYVQWLERQIGAWFAIMDYTTH